MGGMTSAGDQDTVKGPGEDGVTRVLTTRMGHLLPSVFHRQMDMQPGLGGTS